MSGTPDTPERSPGLLAPPPTRGAGVRRLNRLPIVFGVSAAMLVVAAIGYTYRDRVMQATVSAQQAASHKPEPANGSAVLSNAPFGGEVEPAVAKTPLSTHTGRPQTQPAQQPSAMLSDNGGGQTQGEDEATKARREAWRNYYQQLAEVQKESI